MKCLIKSWLRPAKRSASVTFPSGASKIYSLSILTHGKAQRDAALLATFAFAEHQSGDTSKLSACLSDLLLSREAEQRKAMWRCASHRTPKTLPLSKRRTPSLATDNLQHRL